MIVVVAILGIAAIFIVMALPRGRETARFLGCQRNLMHIGVGLQMYAQATGHYPTVPSAIGPTGGDGPLKAMLDALVVPDLLELNDPANPPKPGQPPPRGARVPGLACQSDPNALWNARVPLVSYRANTGSDPAGRGGPFEPGRAATSKHIEAADGLAYTAGFAERLTGDRHDGRPASWNYASSPAAIDRAGCPDLPEDRWRGDAGGDWSESTWRSTLYAHLLVPNAARSCIAEDGRTAQMGASSGHVNRVNLLMMDGSLRVISPTIHPMVWQAMGTIGEPAP